MDDFGLWIKTGVPGGSPHIHWKSMKTPHRKVPLVDPGVDPRIDPRTCGLQDHTARIEQNKTNRRA